MIEQRIAIGGLMRCCLETVRLQVEAGGEPAVNELLSCKYCSGSIIATAGEHAAQIIWRWPGPNGDGS